jgi:hypothetical protein
MKKLPRPVATFLALFVLNGLRAWIVLVAAFFSIALLKAVPSAWRDREWVDVCLLTVFGILLLVVSYRWFAARWIATLQSKPDD